MISRKKIKSQFFVKSKILQTIALIGLAISLIALLFSGGVKALFVLSNETAAVKGETIDIVLGTISLILILGAVGLLLLSLYLIYTNKNQKLISTFLIAMGSTMVIAVLCVLFKGHENYVGDWKDLNDIESAREKIKNIVGDEVFANQVLQTKSDLIAAKVINETAEDLDPIGVQVLLGAFTWPNPAPSSSLLGFWQNDPSITAKDWFADPNGLKAAFENNQWSLKTINTLKDILGKPIQYTGLTDTYLQLYPVDLTFMLTAIISTGLIPVSMILNKKFN